MSETEYIERLRRVIPQWMRDMPNWTQCFQVPKAQPGFSGKIPCGSHSSLETWFSFEDACTKSWFKNNDGVWVRDEDAPLRPGRRLGFQFLNTDLLPIDLDHVRCVRTGEICKEAMSMISDLATYTEISVSGTGFHCIGRGVIRQKQLSSQHIQFWNGRLGVPRFLWITGNVIGDAFNDVRECGKAFQIFASHPTLYSKKMQEELMEFDPEQAKSLPPEAADPIEQQPRERGKQKTQRVHPDFDVYDYIAFNGMKIANECDDPAVGHCIRMTTCPNHGDNTAHAGHNGTTCNFIFPAKDGGFAYHCHSTGCNDGKFTIHDAIRKLAELNGPYEKPIFVAAKKGEKTAPAPVKTTIEITRADKVVRTVTEWLIPEFLPAGEPTAFSGEMDARKSTTAIDIAAKGSTFGGVKEKWFNNTPFEGMPFSTLFMGTEDTVSSTVINRFIAAGGDPMALGFINSKVTKEQEGDDGLQVWKSTLNFREHLSMLRERIRALNDVSRANPDGLVYPVKLLITDPFIAFFGDLNYNRADDCQIMLGGLKELCEELKLCMINIMHFNKTQGASAKEKTGGSKRIVEAHRQAWSFTLIDETDKESNTLISPIKKNLLKVAQSYEITTVSTPVEWEHDGEHFRDEVGVVKFVKLSDKTAEGQILEKESKDKGSRKELMRAILDVLKDGPKPAGQVCSELRDMGSVSSIRRAAADLEEKGKLRRTGTNRNNTTWELEAEPRQEQFFDKEQNNGNQSK